MEVSKADQSQDNKLDARLKKDIDSFLWKSADKEVAPGVYKIPGGLFIPDNRRVTTEKTWHSVILTIQKH